jgi:hypothetical protein
MQVRVTDGGRKVPCGELAVSLISTQEWNIPIFAGVALGDSLAHGLGIV